MTGLFSGMGFKSSFPIADIERIGPGRPGLNGGIKSAEVVLRSGQELQVADFEVGMLMERPVQIMPAEAGTSIVQFFDDFEVYFVPIVGWALCLDGEVRPLTPYGVHTPLGHGRDQEVFIQASDGRVFAATHGCGVYDSFEELVAEKRADNGGQEASHADVEELSS